MGERSLPTHAGRRGVGTYEAKGSKNDFPERIQTDLGRPVLRQKIFLFPSGPTHLLIPHRLVPQRGGSRSSRTRGGMRWTRAHQARERDGRAGAKACERSNGARTNDVAGGRRSRVVLTPRRWRQGGGRHLCPTGLLEVLHSAGDGGKQARSPRRARRKPLKPLRAGTPGEPVYLRSILVCFLLLHTRPRVQRAPGVPHAL